MMGFKEKLIRLGEYTGESAVSICGVRELYAENCRCIVACDENLAVLRMRGTDLRIIGSRLSLENYGAYGVKLTGEIYSLTFEQNAED